MDEQVAAMNEAGYRLEVHVIGDRAAEATIEALEKAEVTPERRPILTHCQVTSFTTTSNKTIIGTSLFIVIFSSDSA